MLIKLTSEAYSGMHRFFPIEIGTKESFKEQLNDIVERAIN